MTTTTRLDQATSITATAGGAGNGYNVALTDPAGQVLGAADSSGTIRDADGVARWHVPSELPGRSDRPLQARLRVLGADGSQLGECVVRKYKIGPRSQHVTMAVVNADATEVAVVAATDGKGAQLAAMRGETRLATVAVSKVKAGFLRKNRVYAIELDPSLDAATRELLVPALVRYDGLLGLVTSAASRD